MNPGDLVYPCFNTYGEVYGPVHDLDYPYEWHPFRMQLPVMDTLKLLAGFGPHSELKKTVLQPLSSLVYIFNTITIIIQPTA